MIKKPYLKKAREYEEDAYKEEAVFKRGGLQSSKKLSDLYKKAGKEYGMVGEWTRAESNYKDALKYALEEDKDKLGSKLSKAREEKKQNLRSFNMMKRKGLEKKFVFATLSMISLIFALFFSVSSLTGYSVSGLTNESFRFGGIILFAMGLVFAFFYFKGKK